MVRRLLARAESTVSDIGAMVLFSGQVLRSLLQSGVSLSQVVDQMFAVGVRSVSTTLVAGGFVGAIMAIQINLQLRDFGAQGFLGGLSTSVTIRNVGPVLIAFILSGKVGAYTSAELGTMQVTDQVSAIRCLGADPVRYLIVPRMVAVVLSSTLLLIVGLMMTIAGGALVAGTQLDINALSYINNIPKLVSWWSVGTGILKSFLFGIIIGIICCYRGYTAKGGALGVGSTVKRTSVDTLVTIIVADFAISQMSALFRELLRVGE